MLGSLCTWIAQGTDGFEGDALILLQATLNKREGRQSISLSADVICLICTFQSLYIFIFTCTSRDAYVEFNSRDVRHLSSVFVQFQETSGASCQQVN